MKSKIVYILEGIGFFGCFITGLELAGMNRTCYKGICIGDFLLLWFLIFIIARRERYIMGLDSILDTLKPRLDQMNSILREPEDLLYLEAKKNIEAKWNKDGDIHTFVYPKSYSDIASTYLARLLETGHDPMESLKFVSDNIVEIVKHSATQTEYARLQRC